MTVYSMVALAITTLGVVIIGFLMRSRRIKEKYVWLWLGLLIGVMVLLAVPNLALRAARMLGFEVPANLILVGAVIVLFGVSVTLSVALSKAEEQIRTLAESVAFLRMDFEAHRTGRAAMTVPPPAARPEGDETVVESEEHQC